MNYNYKIIPNILQYITYPKSHINNDKIWRLYTDVLYQINPILVLRINKYLFNNNNKIMKNEIKNVITQKPLNICNESDLSLRFIINKNTLRTNESLLYSLIYFSVPSFSILLRLLSRCSPMSSKDKPYFSHKMVSLFIVRCFKYYSHDTITFYLPQLVQSLRFDYYNLMRNYLYKISKTSILATHQLIWNLKSESKNDNKSEFSYGYLGLLLGSDPLPKIALEMINDIESLLSPEAKLLYDDEFSFFEILSSISAKLIKDEAQKRYKMLHEYLNDLKTQLSLENKIIYLPSNPYKRIVSINYNSACPMQSAMKAPYLLSFVIEDYDGPDSCVEISKELLEIRKRKMNNNNGNNIQQQHQLIRSVYLIFYFLLLL